MKGLAVKAVISIIVLTFILNVSTWYLPGVAPHDYVVKSEDNEAEPVDLKVDKLTSMRTEIPYDYYNLKFCKPEEITQYAENLGEMLLGEKIENSPYLIYTREPVPCRVLRCRNGTLPLTKSDRTNFQEKIEEEYRVNWIVDNLPSATKRLLESGYVYEPGHLVGEKIGTDFILNNHVDINLKYHDSAVEGAVRIVGFEVRASSKDYSQDTFDRSDPHAVPASCGQPSLRPLVISENLTEVVWTYSVTWENSPIAWGSRWDNYLLMTDNRIHWFSIINSLMILLFLTAMVAMILMKALHRDFGRFNEDRTSEEYAEDSGWKMVYGDVLRPPSHPLLLSISVGNGVQAFAMTFVVMIFAVLGFLSPSNRGVLMESLLIVLVFMSCLAGYFAARNYKLFKGTQWKQLTLGTCFLYSGFIFAIFGILNWVILAAEHSSGTVSWGIMFKLLCLWFIISVPLSCIGTYFGYKKPIPDNPVRVNQIPRQIPTQVWFMRPVFSILMGGILPFGAIFIELFFILSSIWLHQFYYLFGFLFIVFIILIITCAEISIVMCYFQLCAEDYHWWWRSFLTSGAAAFYMFLYSVFYYMTKLPIIGFASGVLYFGYTIIMSTYFFLLSGVIGYYACLWFVNRIYREIHHD